MAKGQLWQIILRPHLQITRAKWTGGVAQAVEHLLSKHKALSLNPSNTKKRKKEKKKKKYKGKKCQIS
jgi:hypothetical protein